MTIPKLPTDNLYKFVALFGLAAAIASFGLREIRSHAVAIQRADVLGKLTQTVELGDQADLWSSEWKERWREFSGEEWDGDWFEAADRLDEASDDLEARISAADSEEAKAALLKDWRKLRRVMGHVPRAPVDQATMSSMLSEAVVAHELLMIEEGRLRRLSWVLVTSGVIGILLAGAGFWLWYKRFQLYQDLIVRLQADSADQSSSTVAVDQASSKEGDQKK